MKFAIKQSCLLLVAISTFTLAQAQVNSWGLIGGVGYGGPLPTNAPEDSEGTVFPSPKLGFDFELAINENLSTVFQLYYAYRSLKYAASVTEDTIVEAEIGGQTQYLPSFYTTNVKGKMKLHYLDLPILLKYRIGTSRFSGTAGIFFSGIIAGSDKGKTRTIIGEGGFFEDITERYDNLEEINRFDAGLAAGFDVELHRYISLEFSVMRGFVPLYKADFFTGRGFEENRLYNTYVYLGLKWYFHKPFFSTAGINF